MSASKEKQRRQLERQGGADGKQAKKVEEEKKQKRNRILGWIFGVLFGLFLVFSVVINSSLPYKFFTAVTVGGEKFTAAEFNYFYFSGYYDYVNTYESYGILQYMGLDTSTPLKDQEYPGDEYDTWQDYFEDAALEKMKKVTALVKAAKAEGFDLSAESMEEIDAALESYASAAVSYGYSSADQYAKAAFGQGANMSMIRKMMEITALAYDYSSSKYEAFEYSDEELDAFYNSKNGEYDDFTYLSYSIYPAEDYTEYPEGEEPTEEEQAAIAEELFNAARETANDLASRMTDVFSFESVVLEHEGVEAGALFSMDDLTTNSKGSYLNGNYSEWLRDASRKRGDVTVIETEYSCDIVMFMSRNDNNYATKDVRHILVRAVEEEPEPEDEDEEPIDYENLSEEEIAAAEAEAEAKAAAEEERLHEEAKARALALARELYEEWKAGDATEESFGEMANEHSDDTGSNTNGGLYEDVQKDTMVSEFDEWIYNQSRQPGDTGIVYGETTGYFGYHIMYFVGNGRLLRHIIADDAKRGEDYTAWETGKTEGAVIRRGMTMFLTK